MSNRPSSFLLCTCSLFPLIPVLLPLKSTGQMTEALGFSADLTPASLALFSAAQGASRVVTGIASELALKWNLPWFCGCCSASGSGAGVPRPVFLVLASLVSALSHFILAVSTSDAAFAFGVTLSGVVGSSVCVPLCSFGLPIMRR